MRVGLLAQTARGDTRIGREIAAKVGYFRNRGADTRLIVANDGDFPRRIRANTQRYSPQLPDRLLTWLAKCDLVLVDPAEPSPIFDLVPKLTGGKPKVVFTDHGDSESRELAWFADVAIVHDPGEKEAFLAETGYPANRTELLHEPVDLSWFQPGTAERPLRNLLGIDSHSRLLLIAGRLAPRRRGPSAIDALAQLPASVHLVFVGESGEECEPERQRCRERAARNRVADRIHFLGSVDDRQLRDAYRDADLLIAPAGSLSAVEAIACGLPVIENRSGCHATELATEVRRILNPPSAAEVQRPAGFNLAAQFSLSLWQDRFGQVIDQLLESQTHARRDSQHELSGPNRPVRRIQAAQLEDAA